MSYKILVINKTKENKIKTKHKGLGKSFFQKKNKGLGKL